MEVYIFLKIKVFEVLFVQFTLGPGLQIPRPYIALGPAQGIFWANNTLVPNRSPPLSQGSRILSISIVDVVERSNL